jgi:hypothetical protein
MEYMQRGDVPVLILRVGETPDSVVLSWMNGDELVVEEIPEEEILVLSASPKRVCSNASSGIREAVVGRRADGPGDIQGVYAWQQPAGYDPPCM